MRGNISGWMVTFVMILWMGCASSSAPPDYYGLQSRTDTPGQHAPSQLTIGLGPVQLPDYLDRSTIVTRLSPNRLQIHADKRWAGSLQSEITRVLGANLKNETGSRQVVLFPWGSDVEPDIRFRVVIHAFEGGTANGVHLNTTWSIAWPASDRAVVLHDSELVERVAGKGFESLTEAMGRALSALSHEMAAAALSADPSVSGKMNN